MTTSGLLRPDPGTPVTPDATTAPGANGVEQTASAGQSEWIQLAASIPTPVWIGVAALITIAVTIRVIRRRKNRDRPATTLDKLMTFIGAAVATGVVGTGMWAFFGDTLGITNDWLRAALFAFFEIAMLASALRSRRFRLDRAERATQVDAEGADDSDEDEIDVDGIAVWVLALLSGALAATHETALGAIGLRLVAPIIAAWLWERGIAGELRQFRRTKRRRINWTITPERVFARLGMAEATGRDITDVDRARRIARFARTVYRLHQLQAANALGLRVAFVAWRRDRQLIQLNERLNLAMDRSVMAEVRTHLATLYQAQEGVAPAAVRSLSPWDEQPEPVRVRATTGQPTDTAAGRDPGTLPGVLSGANTGTVPAEHPGTAVDIVTGQAPDISPDATPAPNPGIGRTIDPGTQTVRLPAPHRASSPPKTRARKPSPAQVKAEKIRAKDPDISWSELASRVGVDDRTVRRWFPPKRAEVPTLDLRPDVVLPLPAPTPPVMSGTNGHPVAVVDTTDQ